MERRICALDRFWVVGVARLGPVCLYLSPRYRHSVHDALPGEQWTGRSDEHCLIPAWYGLFFILLRSADGSNGHLGLANNDVVVGASTTIRDLLSPYQVAHNYYPGFTCLEIDPTL